MVVNEYNELVNILVTEGTDNWQEVQGALSDLATRCSNLGSGVCSLSSSPHTHFCDAQVLAGAGVRTPSCCAPETNTTAAAALRRCS